MPQNATTNRLAAEIGLMTVSDCGTPDAVSVQAHLVKNMLDAGTRGRPDRALHAKMARNMAWDEHDQATRQSVTPVQRDLAFRLLYDLNGLA